MKVVQPSITLQQLPVRRSWWCLTM